MSESDSDLKRAALDYHEAHPPGKIAIHATKPVANQRDLSLAYSPGVAHACTAIAEDPANATRFTARGNLVGVITNGTAVLGLGGHVDYWREPDVLGIVHHLLTMESGDTDIIPVAIRVQPSGRIITEAAAAMQPAAPPKAA